METSTAASKGRRPVKVVADDDEVALLRAEVARLQELVGPSEESYVKLRLDVLGARDAAIAAEVVAGRLRGRVVELESEVAKLRRSFVWLVERVINRVLSPRTGQTVLSMLRRARSLVRR